MHEMVPLVSGVVIAFLVLRFGAGTRSKIITLLVCSAAIGAIASFVSGELLVSWTFIAIDIALTLLAAGVTIALWDSRQHWLSRRQPFDQ